MENPVIDQRHSHIPMSSQAFANWGSEAFAYLKPELEGSISGYAIYAADGRHLAFTENRDIAKALVIQNDLIPVDIQ